MSDPIELTPKQATMDDNKHEGTEDEKKECRWIEARRGVNLE